MKNDPYLSQATLTERIAVHLTDFPLNRPCVSNIPSDQLLNDVLNRLRLLYPGAFSEFSPLVPIVPVPVTAL